jgi:sugar lactone lactonase YvrE
VIWETEASLLTPESVIYDPANNVFYVSNYDYMYYTKGYPTGYVSKISPDGRILEKEWIKGLFAPTGMCVIGNRLYIVVRNGIIVIGTKKGNYITQYDIPEAVFLNDATADSLGRIYITDSSGDPAKPDIYILENKQIKPWLQSEAISNTNGIHEYHGKLFIGNNGEGLFQAVNIKDKSIETICNLGPGTIDGIRPDNEGNWLVSHWEGKIFRVSHSGQITEIFDTRIEGYNAADFEFSNQSGNIIIPTFLGNKVTALKIK